MHADNPGDEHTHTYADILEISTGTHMQTSWR